MKKQLWEGTVLIGTTLLAGAFLVLAELEKRHPTLRREPRLINGNDDLYCFDDFYVNGRGFTTGKNHGIEAHQW